MGIAGAALATGIGQMMQVVFYLIVYFCPADSRTSAPQLPAFQPQNGTAALLDRRTRHFKSRTAVGAHHLSEFSLGFYSQSYIVVLGIYYKLQTFLYLPANGIVQGLRPIIGYNYGAGEYGRVKKVYRTAMAMCAAIMAAGTLLCLVLSEQLIGLFSTNSETIVIGTTALRIICTGFLVSIDFGCCLARWRAWQGDSVLSDFPVPLHCCHYAAGLAVLSLCRRRRYLACLLADRVFDGRHLAGGLPQKRKAEQSIIAQAPHTRLV